MKPTNINWIKVKKENLPAYQEPVLIFRDYGNGKSSWHKGCLDNISEGAGYFTTEWLILDEPTAFGR